MKKSRFVELTKKEYEVFRLLLKALNIKFSPSECYNLIHIELWITEEEEEYLQAFLNTMEKLEEEVIKSEVEK